MINNSVTNDIIDATAQETQAAMMALIANKGSGYAAAFNLPDCKWIDSEDREELARIIATNR